MNVEMDFDRLFFNRKTAIALGLAATLSLGGVASKWMSIQYTPTSQPGFVVLLTLSVAMALGAISLFLAMWLYWVKCDISSKRSRTIWFFVLLLGLFSGAPQVLYYLAVYLPGVRKRLNEVER